MKLNAVLYRLLLHLHNNNCEARGRAPSIPKCQGIALWPLLPKYSSFGSESPALLGRGVWDYGMGECLGEWRLWGWAGSMQGWGGRHLQGLRGLVSLQLLHGDIKAQKVMGQSWGSKKHQNLLASSGQWYQCPNKPGH